MSQKSEDVQRIAQGIVRYPSLKRFCENMLDYAERFATQTLECQEEGFYVVNEDEIPTPLQDPDFLFSVLEEMLSDRPEFEYVEADGGNINIEIKPEYQKSEISEDITHEQTM